MAVDKSNGAHRGRIYVVLPVLENGNGKAVVQYTFSDNQGATWSNPVTISIPNGRQNWMPWITVDDCTGDVWAIYYSFDTPSGFTTNTYVAHSADGGTTWENEKVSDVSHTTAPINNTIFANGYAGDYIGIAAFGGRAYPIWMDDRNGTWQLYCSPALVEAPSVTINGPDRFCGSGTYSLSTLPTGYNVLWSSSNPSIADVPPSSTSNSVIATRFSNGNFDLIATLTPGGGCASSITVTKNINVGNVSSTTTINLSISAQLCTGYVFTASVTPNPDATNYLWTPPLGVTLTGGQNTPNATFTVNSTGGGNGVVTMDISTPCGTICAQTFLPTGPKWIFIKNQPAFSALALCFSGTATVNVIQATGATSYVWQVREYSGGGIWLNLTAPLITTTTNQLNYTVLNPANISFAVVYVYALSSCGQSSTLQSQRFDRCRAARIAFTGETFFDDHTVLIYPNPAKNSFTIDTRSHKGLVNREIREVQIANKMGEVKRYFRFSNKQSTQFISTRGLSPDIYTIRIFDGQKWIIEKVIVL